MRISDWSSDVCSSDLGALGDLRPRLAVGNRENGHVVAEGVDVAADVALGLRIERGGHLVEDEQLRPAGERAGKRNALALAARQLGALLAHHRSEEHTSDLQSLMLISYAVFCLKK